MVDPLEILNADRTTTGITYHIEVRHPKGKSIFTCDSATKAWAAAQAMCKAFPQAKLHYSAYCPSRMPPVLQLSLDDLIRESLAGDTMSHHHAGTIVR